MRKLAFTLTLFLICGVQIVFAQKVVTGKVTDANDGTSLPGVNVSIKGTNLGTTTGASGEYSLRIPANSKTLVFSFVGYDKQEIPVGSTSVINVIMKPSATTLDEVVITAFGIKRQARELGYATTQVDNNAIVKAGATNVVTGLTGKVSGLQINTTSNGVNPDTRITLRGNRHFLASNQALVVLDGIPVSATYLNSINPNDISSVNVLKGASASALYGNDASNGVLIVTTKKGEIGRLTVKVSNTTSFEQISYLPNLQTRFGGGSNEVVGQNDPNYTMWLGPDRNTEPYTSYENQSYGPEFNGQQVILGGKLVDGTYQMIPYSPIKNQKLNFFNIGHSIQNDVSISGADDNSSFYLSAQDVNTTGTVPDDVNRRTGTRFAAGKKYGILSADFTLGFTQTATNTSGGDMNQGRGVYWNVLNTPAEVPITKYKDIVNNPFATVDGYFNAYYPNPYWQIAHARNKTKRDDILGSLNLSVKPLSWLVFTNRSGLTFNTINNHNYRDEAVYNSYSESNPWGGGHMGTLSPYSGNSSDQMRATMILTNDFLAMVDTKFDNFKLKAIFGNSIYSQQYETNYDAASSLVIPGLYNISNRFGDPVVSQSTQKRNSIGVFGDVTVGYKELAFLHFSGRNDWDSRLTKANRSFFYPAVDGSIVLSDLFPSIIDNKVLSFLKVRGGWSKTGQIALNDWYGTLPSYLAGTGFPFNSAGFVLNTTLSNPLLRPEKTSEIELGTEISFLKNKIHLEANVYKSNTIDQTIPATISASTGFYSALINTGELENKGIEADLKFTPLLNLGPVVWNFSVNYSYTISKVLSVLPGLPQIPINDGTNTSVSYAVVGQQYPSILVSDVLRDPKGNIVVDPITGRPTKDPEIKNMGHGNPNHILGLATDLSYKGFRLSLVAEYRGGNVIFNAVGQSLDFTGISEHSAQNGRQPFIIPNSVIQTSPGVYVPNTTALVDGSRTFWAGSAYSGDANTSAQSTYVTSAAFWKLREAALTYDLPVNKILGGKVIKQAQVSIIGRNLLMLRPRTNSWTDPEFNNSASTSNAVGLTTEDQTPPTRFLGFSVKLTF